MEIIQRVLTVLNKKKLKQKELADFLEVDKSVITTWKTRLTDPPAKYIVKICEFLGVSADYLLTGKETHQKELSEEEQELLNLFNKLSLKEKYRLLGKLEAKTDYDMETAKEIDEAERFSIVKMENSRVGK